MRAKADTHSRRTFLNFLSRMAFVPAAVVSAGPAETVATRPGRQVLLNDFAIAGFQYYGGRSELPNLTAGTQLTLHAEPANPHDAFAVEIFHGSVKLGYVPRLCNRHISRLLRQSVPLACEVESVNPHAPSWEALHVKILLSEPPVRAQAG